MSRFKIRHELTRTPGRRLAPTRYRARRRPCPRRARGNEKLMDRAHRFTTSWRSCTVPPSAHCTFTDSRSPHLPVSTLPCWISATGGSHGRARCGSSRCWRLHSATESSQPQSWGGPSTPPTTVGALQSQNWDHMGRALWGRYPVDHQQPMRSIGQPTRLTKHVGVAEL